VLTDLLDAMPSGVWTTADLPALLVLAGSFSTWCDANEHIKADNLIVKGSEGGLIHNPFLKIRNQQAVLILRAAEAVGCTPAARVRMAQKPDDSDPLRQDPWAEFANH